MQTHKNYFLGAFLGIIVFFGLVVSQAMPAELLEWNEEESYRPNPIIFVHGITSSRTTFDNTITAFIPFLDHYYYTNQWDGLIQQGSNDAPYLYTFDYSGNQPGQTRESKNSMDHIEYNATVSGRQQGIDNGDLDPSDPRETLEERIQAVYTAYASNVLLVCHSMGGTVAHYYLTSAYEDGFPSRVRRYVTFKTRIVH